MARSVVTTVTNALFVETGTYDFEVWSGVERSARAGFRSSSPTCPFLITTEAVAADSPRDACGGVAQPFSPKRVWSDGNADDDVACFYERGRGGSHR